MFNLSINQDENALKLIKKVYHPSENYESVLKTLKGQVLKRSPN